MKSFEKMNVCPFVPKKLKQLELIIQQENEHTEIENISKQPVIQFEHIIEAGKIFRFI
jgi:hypothetical protein